MSENSSKIIDKMCQKVHFVRRFVCGEYKVSKNESIPKMTICAVEGLICECCEKKLKLKGKFMFVFEPPYNGSEEPPYCYEDNERILCDCGAMFAVPILANKIPTLQEAHNTIVAIASQITAEEYEALKPFHILPLVKIDNTLGVCPRRVQTMDRKN